MTGLEVVVLALMPPLVLFLLALQVHLALWVDFQGAFGFQMLQGVSVFQVVAVGFAQVVGFHQLGVLEG